jgi:hypothetical protein
MSSTTGSIGSGASTSGASTSSPPCPTCGVNVEAAFSKIDIARRKLQLRQETLQTEQALLKADKRNFKRRLKAAKLTAANSQIQVERIQAESVASEQAAKRKYQEYQQRLEAIGSEKQNESERQHQQELQFLKQEIEELVSLQKQEKGDESNNANSNNGTGTGIETSATASPSESKQELTDCRQQIDRLQRELENKESALESCEMQLFELERERDDGYSNNNNNNNHGGDDNSENGDSSGDGGYSNSHHNATICFNCNRLAPKLERAEEDLAALRIAKETEESRLSGQVTELREQALALKTNQVERPSQEATNELQRLRDELKEYKTLEQDNESTIALQKQQLEELMLSNKALLDQQQFRVAVVDHDIDDKNNINGDAALGAIQQRPPEPDEETHRHVMEFEWHGPKEAGVYTGWLLKSTGNPDNSGTLRLEEGDVYDGNWKDGKQHGHGVFVTLDGDIYNGGWNEGLYHGYGVFVWSAGKVYRGDYVNGERHGRAVMTWPYGANYQGEYANDKRNGQGIYVYADGRCYTGEYRDERCHGYGQLKATDGTIIYDGAWEFGEYLGK